MKKIGVFTILKNNYGAMLQAYGTYNYFTNKKIQIEFINYITKKEYYKDNYYFTTLNIKSLLISIYYRLSPKLRLRRFRFKSFLRLMNVNEFIFEIGKVKSTIAKYDALAVGSDQVWFMDKIKQNNIFLLPFNHVFKFSFSSSFGSDNFNSQKNQLFYSSLRDFKHITIRENSGKKYLRGIGLNSDVVLDPTLLIEKSEWINLSKDKRIIEDNYILIYGIDASDLSDIIVSKLNKYNKKIVLITNAIYSKQKVDIIFLDAGPIEFLNLIRYADFVYTSSFHGVCFSIIFERDFLVNTHKTRNTRISNILKSLDISERQINSLEGFTNNYENKINYESVQKLLKIFREKSDSIISEIIEKI